MRESCVIPTHVLAFSNEIQSLKYQGDLVINDGKLSYYNQLTHVSEEILGENACHTKAGVYTSRGTELLLSDQVVEQVCHRNRIQEISYTNGAIIVRDERDAVIVLTVSGEAIPLELDYNMKIIGVVGRHIFVSSEVNIKVYEGNTSTYEVQFKGVPTCYNKSPKFAVTHRTTVSIWEVGDQHQSYEIHCTEELGNPIFHYISEDDLFLYVADNSSITLWSLYDYRYIGKIVYEGIERIAVAPENIYISSGKMLRVYLNPAFKECGTYTIVAPENYTLRYWCELREIVHNPGEMYKDFMNHCLILPICCNVLHIFTEQVNVHCIKLALSTRCAFFRTASSMQSPITFALMQKTHSILDYYSKSIGGLMEIDDNTIFRAEEDVLGLNSIGTSRLVDFYKSALVIPKQPLPKFGIPLQKGQNIRVSNSKQIRPLDFIKKEAPPINSRDIETMKAIVIDIETVKGNKVALEFRISAFRLPMSLGSDKSLEFLNSLLDCSNHKILVTPLLRSLLHYKWSIIFYWMLSQAILFNILLLLLEFYMFYPDVKVIFVFIQIINAIFFIYECLQASIGFQSYFRSFWNSIDLIRIFLILLLFFGEDLGFFYNISLSYIILVTWIKAISYFRIYRPTRYLINIIKQSAQDTIPFLIILVYLTLTFALTIYNIKIFTGNHIDFSEAWIQMYSLNFNDFKSSEYGNLEWVFVIIAAMINSLVLMNMIIALLGNTYAIVKENAQVADLRELVELIIETESILIWKRGHNEKHYLQICAAAENIDQEEEMDMAGYVKQISAVIPRINESVKAAIENEKSQLDIIENSLRTTHHSFVTDIDKIIESVNKDQEYLKGIINKNN